ncbi:MAG: dephospho-CoA kinase [Pseudomonadota bacterium]|nr:dephospho-CoA kinase [Pseudomonadota bacterium]
MCAVVAITGGIAAGKTVLSDYCFKRHNISVIDTDIITHNLLATDKVVHAEIQKIFGSGVFLLSGGVDRKILREAVFLDKDKKNQLEKIMHPRIRQTVQTFVESSDDSFVMVVVPLLLETNARSRYDRVVVVDSPDHDRYSRCIERGLSDDIIHAIMRLQASRWDRLAVADDIVYNMRSLDFFYRQIDQLVCHYRRLFGD